MPTPIVRSPSSTSTSKRHLRSSTTSRSVARATLREVVEGRKLRFDVEVTEGERTIGVGTHERRVVGQAGPPTA